MIKSYVVRKAPRKNLRISSRACYAVRFFTRRNNPQFDAARADARWTFRVHRARLREQCRMLAGWSNLNPLELVEGHSSYKLIVAETQGFERLLADVYSRSLLTRRCTKSRRIWMPRMVRCAGVRRGSFFMDIAGVTAISRCMSSVRRIALCTAVTVTPIS